MTANYTHATSAHGCKIAYTFDNCAARIEYPQDSGLPAEEFTSEPIEFKRVAGKGPDGQPDGSHENRAIKGEPTATMQALQAAKRFFLEAEAAAEKAEGEQVAAAVEKAKAKAAAANAPKPKK